MKICPEVLITVSSYLIQRLKSKHVAEDQKEGVKNE